MPQLRWVTFDCYGTLVNWLHGVATSFELLFPGRGKDAVEAFTRHETIVQQESPRMRYADVLAAVARRMAKDLGARLHDDDADILARTLPYWPVFPDTAPALQQLRERGCRLALLTNCDADLNALTRRRLGVPIDAVVTAEDAGAYKPAHAHFLRFQDALGVRRDQWVHVAESHYHDVVPAHALGIRAVWVNRLGQERDASLAAHVLPDLVELPTTLEGLFGSRE